ncbi:MAG: hypothetical protein K2P84_05105, partial [Undibacterium sp.]|nr:hypothetical protein [Undibacterium sp.]
KKRAPELLRLSNEDQVTRLAAELGVNSTELAHAWLDAPASTPLGFTRQIQLLQQLRKHYEQQRQHTK